LQEVIPADDTGHAQEIWRWWRRATWPQRV